MKVETDSNGARTTIRLIGRVSARDIEELTRQLQSESRAIATIIDLREVTLVDLEVVRFLMVCEARGTRIENCPSYVRQWMIQERSV